MCATIRGRWTQQRCMTLCVYVCVTYAVCKRFLAVRWKKLRNKPHWQQNVSF